VNVITLRDIEVVIGIVPLIWHIIRGGFVREVLVLDMRTENPKDLGIERFHLFDHFRLLHIIIADRNEGGAPSVLAIGLK
ncbi:MAG: hypothetical protein RL025_1461, partial [Bacteroidota bacterium]